jgi:hypothetical protein
MTMGQFDASVNCGDAVIRGRVALPNEAVMLAVAESVNGDMQSGTVKVGTFPHSSQQL